MRRATWIAVVVWIIAAGATTATPEDGEDPVALVARLSLDGAPRMPGGGSDPVEARLAALGESALPALESEMHLELRGHEEQAFIDSGKSRRYAVIRVLGRIEGARSTGILIATVRAYGDFNGLCDDVVYALRSRALTAPELELLLLSASPSGVLFALGKAGTLSPDSPLRTVAMDLLDIERVRQQLRNENGHPVGGEEALWEIHLAAGRALGKDMVPEVRDRATDLVGDLLAVPGGGWKGTGRSDRFSYLSSPELEVNEAVRHLLRLGAPARAVVEGARKKARGDEAMLLDIALLAFGDADRLTAVAGTLTDSPNASLRLCAAMVLRGTKDSRARAAWWKAMDDPLRRPNTGCVRIQGQDEVYPVRQIAADALIGLGEPPGVVRARLRPPGPGIPALKLWTLAGLVAVAVLLGLWAWAFRVRRMRRCGALEVS